MLLTMLAIPCATMEAAGISAELSLLSSALSGLMKVHLRQLVKMDKSKHGPAAVCSAQASSMAENLSTHSFGRQRVTQSSTVKTKC